MKESPENHRVLIVDDNPAIHEDFRKILCLTEEEHDPFEAAAFGKKQAAPVRNAFAVSSAYQGSEALDIVCQALADHKPFGVVFMDVRMPPGWDGIETTARLWEKDPDLQVVICTAFSDYSWEKITETLNHSDQLVILKKPFDAIEVQQLAHCLARKWQLLQESKMRVDELTKEVADRTDQVSREQARFKTIFDNSPIGIFQTSPEGRILCANRAFAHMAGYDSPGAIAQEITEIATQLYVDPARREEFRRRLELNKIVRDFEIELRSRNGSKKWLNVTAFVVAGANGAPNYYEGFIYDLTERKQAEEERNAMEVQLRHAQKMDSIGRLAAGIAHEINTPIQYVGDNTRFVQDSFRDIGKALEELNKLLAAAKAGPLTAMEAARAQGVLTSIDLPYLQAEIPRAIEESLEGIARISKIVHAMKEFSHPGEKEKLAVNLNKCIETTVMVARSEWKYVADVTLELDPSLPLVSCFVSEFNQAILNLLVNAAHAIGEVVAKEPTGKGAIVIRSRADGDMVDISVSDTGAGIPEEIRHRIFDPFFTTKEIGKGTGQGLTVVYNSVVKMHHGSITFDSTLGKGTTFTMRLPINGRRSAEAAQIAAAPPVSEPA